MVRTAVVWVVARRDDQRHAEGLNGKSILIGVAVGVRAVRAGLKQYVDVVISVCKICMHGHPADISEKPTLGNVGWFFSFDSLIIPEETHDSRRHNTLELLGIPLEVGVICVLCKVVHDVVVFDVGNYVQVVAKRRMLGIWRVDV